MKNKYVISSLTALSAISTASCNHGMKPNIQYFEIGVGGNVLSFPESDSENLFGTNGSMQGYIARNNGICGMIDVYASWNKRTTFTPNLPSKSGIEWTETQGFKGYVLDGDIAIGKDFCLSDDKTIRHHRTREHDLYNRIAIGIDIGGRKTRFKSRDSGDMTTAVSILSSINTYAFFVGAKCKMMYPMDNALLVFDIKAGPVVYGKGEYEAIISVANSPNKNEKLKTEHNIGAEVKAGFSGIYRMDDNNFGIGMRVSVDYNYRSEKVKSISSSSIFAATKDEELDGAFSNNIIGTIEFIFVYSTV